VGTIFVLGKHEEVLRFSHPMVINPFQGYPEEEQKHIRPRLKGTVKEFSSIDGAFIFREDGSFWQRVATSMLPERALKFL
jgi:DNA integrity scanning protein DisA with diadenylate cyclase activity